MTTDKNKKRNQLLKKRSALDHSRIKESSLIIKNKLLSITEFKNAERFMTYISYKNEVNTYHLINELLENGKQVFVPYCIKKERKIEIAPIYDLENDLEEGTYGIPEPKSELRQNYSPGALDIVIVPAVAFSQNGYRIGYGGGYYDRFLPRLNERTITIGLTYEDLLLTDLPTEEHDLPVDYVVTEERLINCKEERNE